MQRNARRKFPCSRLAAGKVGHIGGGADQAVSAVRQTPDTQAILIQGRVGEKIHGGNAFQAAAVGQMPGQYLVSPSECVASDDGPGVGGVPAGQGGLPGCRFQFHSRLFERIRQFIRYSLIDQFPAFHLAFQRFHKPLCFIPGRFGLSYKFLDHNGWVFHNGHGAVFRFGDGDIKSSGHSRGLFRAIRRRNTRRDMHGSLQQGVFFARCVGQKNIISAASGGQPRPCHQCRTRPRNGTVQHDHPILYYRSA